MSLQTMENKEQSFDTALASSVRSPRTISVVLDAIGYGRFQVLLSFSSGLAFLADAMEMMILSVLAPALHCSTWEVTKSQLAFLTTMVFLAMTIRITNHHSLKFCKREYFTVLFLLLIVGSLD